MIDFDLTEEQKALQKMARDFAEKEIRPIAEKLDRSQNLLHTETIEPVISPAYNAGVLKGARHPNLGRLLPVFLATTGAQEIWESYGGRSSAFIPGTTAYKYAQDKNALDMTREHAEMVTRLTREFGKIPGFN